MDRKRCVPINFDGACIVYVIISSYTYMRIKQGILGVQSRSHGHFGIVPKAGCGLSEFKFHLFFDKMLEIHIRLRTTYFGCSGL